MDLEYIIGLYQGLRTWLSYDNINTQRGEIKFICYEIDARNVSPSEKSGTHFKYKIPIPS